MVSMLEWLLTALGAVVVGVVLGAMLLLGATMARLEQERKGPDAKSETARRRVPRVRRFGDHDDRENVFIRRG